jgi:hypothetical protein
MIVLDDFKLNANPNLHFFKVPFSCTCNGTEKESVRKGDGMEYSRKAILYLRP